MPRTKRITLGNYVYHVFNRANGRLRIFRKDENFLAFEKILAEGVERFSMRICGFCIMGNHWHLLLWPKYDGHYLTVLRYIEANPVRAKIVKDVGNWRWSSFTARQGTECLFKLSPGPVELPRQWDKLVRQQVESREAENLEKSMQRGMPFGDLVWRQTTARKFGLESTMRPKGRPKKCTGHL